MTRLKMDCCYPCPTPVCGPSPPMICCPQPVCCPEPCCPPKRCKSRELRGGILYTSCDCPKRNGLADDCRKRECFGRPRCITKPIPVCCPSKYNFRYANVTMGKPSFPRPPKKSNNNSSCCPPPICCPKPICCPIVCCDPCPPCVKPYCM